MPLEVFTIDEKQEWDSLVRSFKEYDVYYLSGYVRAFQIHGDGEPLLFYFKKSSEKGMLRGINVVMKRDISEDIRFNGRIEPESWYDFSTPYGYGGWIVEGEDRESLLSLFEEYCKWCEQNNIVAEFVRYHPVLNNYQLTNGFYDVCALGPTISVDLENAETIWHNFTGKNRNKIRKAMKSGIRIYNGRHPLLFERFREIYNDTMDKNSADNYYYFKSDFYQSILTDLALQAQVFFAELNGAVIAAAIILASNGHLSYHLSGTVREYQNLAPTNLMLYKAALWGCANGYRTLHLGGGVGSARDGLYKFKESFYRGEPKRFHIGRRIFLNHKYKELVKIREIEDKRFNQETSFFPQYRG